MRRKHNHLSEMGSQYKVMTRRMTKFDLYFKRISLTPVLRIDLKGKEGIRQSSLEAVSVVQVGDSGSEWPQWRW